MFSSRALLKLSAGAIATLLPVVCHAQNPVAIDDLAMTDSHHEVHIDVLLNDQPGWTGALLDPTTVEIVSGPVSGSASVNPNTGVITYEPVRGSWGVASIEYGALDLDGNPTNVGVVDIWVMHSPPTANDDMSMTSYDQSIVLNVLANDYGGTAPIDPDSVEITQLPQRGNLTMGQAGAITYTPAGVDPGGDSFEYVVYDEDGVASEPARVDVWVMNSPPMISGFSNWQASGGYWYFEGYVNDENPDACTVEFGGILAGHAPVSPQPDGKFSFVVQLGSGPLFVPARAIAIDDADQESQQAETFVYSY
jgi:hypothetical protein